MLNPNKPYMLLRPLPMYERNTVNTRRYWTDVIGCSDEYFDILIEEGWFK